MNEAPFLTILTKTLISSLHIDDIFMEVNHLSEYFSLLELTLYVNKPFFKSYFKFFSSINHWVEN